MKTDQNVHQYLCQIMKFRLEGFGTSKLYFYKN